VLTRVISVSVTDCKNPTEVNCNIGVLSARLAWIGYDHRAGEYIRDQSPRGTDKRLALL
jgi:hypothetical protein